MRGTGYRALGVLRKESSACAGQGQAEAPPMRKGRISPGNRQILLPKDISVLSFQIYLFVNSVPRLKCKCGLYSKVLQRELLETWTKKN